MSFDATTGYPDDFEDALGQMGRIDLRKREKYGINNRRIRSEDYCTGVHETAGLFPHIPQSQSTAMLQ